MRRPSATYLGLAALSGCIWGVIAFVLSGSAFPVEIWGGVLTSLLGGHEA